LNKMFATILLCAGCGHGDVLVSPTSLDFGEVDFQTDIPEAGYGAIDVSITNVGKKDLDLTIRGFDATRLVIGGFFPETPYVMDTLPSGAATTISVGVLSYEPGERDTLVEGSFDVTADNLKDPVTVTWSFTPIRNIGGDTSQ
jgi:hypothetical protein